MSDEYITNEINVLDLGYNRDLTKYDDEDLPIKDKVTDSVSASLIGSGEAVQNISVVDGHIQSDNYESGSTGWRLSPEQAEFNTDITVSGYVEVTGGSYQSSDSGARVELFPDSDTGLQVIDDDGNNVLEALVGGTNVGDVTIGDYSGGQGLKYDKDLGKIYYKNLQWSEVVDDDDNRPEDNADVTLNQTGITDSNISELDFTNLTAYSISANDITTGILTGRTVRTGSSDTKRIKLHHDTDLGSGAIDFIDDNNNFSSRTTVNIGADYIGGIFESHDGYDLGKSWIEVNQGNDSTFAVIGAAGSSRIRADMGGVTVYTSLDMRNENLENVGDINGTNADDLSAVIISSSSPSNTDALWVDTG